MLTMRRYTTSRDLTAPATETFSPGGVLSEPRSGHTATLLPDGHVLVAGGRNHDCDLASAEVWEPHASPATQQPP